MDRLTEKVFGFVQLKACGNDFCKETCAEHDEEKSCKNCHIQKAFEKLAEYEDLDEQGLLLRLPVKAGDTIYYIEDNKVNKFIVYSFDIRPLQLFVCDYEGIRLNFKNFGKTVFLTQAEAEQKLKEMEV